MIQLCVFTSDHNMLSAKQHRTPILVTGCPRSGTTWMGNTIGASDKVMLLYEPLNNDAPLHIGAPSRFYQVTHESPSHIRAACDDLVSLGSLHKRLQMGAKGIAQWVMGQRKAGNHFAARSLTGRGEPFLSPKRSCIKDPIAFYSAEWFAEQHNANVVVMVRHPCSVISSYLKLGWTSDMAALKQRPVPGGYKELENRIQNWEPGSLPLDDLILQWKLLSARTLSLQKQYPGWTYIVHDRLCNDPEAWFENIFKRLDLQFTDNIREKVRAESSEENTVDPEKHVQHMHSRASRTIANAWRTRLKPAIAEKILAETDITWNQILEALPATPDALTR